MARRIHEVMAEAMRERIWKDVAPPPAMLQRSLDKLAAKLEAKRRTYITFQGVVTKVVEDDDHDAQLKAIAEINKLSGAHIQTTSDKPSPPTVRLRYDPVTGVREIIIGDTSITPEGSEGDDLVTLPALAPLPSTHNALTREVSREAVAEVDNVTNPEMFAERIRAKRGGYDAAFKRRLFDEIAAIDAEDKANTPPDTPPEGDAS